MLIAVLDFIIHSLMVNALMKSSTIKWKKGAIVERLQWSVQFATLDTRIECMVIDGIYSIIAAIIFIGVWKYTLGSVSIPPALDVFKAPVNSVDMTNKIFGAGC